MENNEMILAVDCVHGVYIPKRFMSGWSKYITNNVELSAEIVTIAGGEMDEDYWYAWGEIVERAVIEWNGKQYHIIERDDLWLEPMEPVEPEPTGIDLLREALYVLKFMPNIETAGRMFLNSDILERAIENHLKNHNTK